MMTSRLSTAPKKKRGNTLLKMRQELAVAVTLHPPFDGMLLHLQEARNKQDDLADMFRLASCDPG
eukprot:4780895-Prorocentrum_lima.AAC.1